MRRSQRNTPTLECTSTILGALGRFEATARVLVGWDWTQRPTQRTLGGSTRDADRLWPACQGNGNSGHSACTLCTLLAHCTVSGIKILPR